MREIKVFIGFDPRQPVAFQVCAQSIWENVSCPLSVTRLDLRNLPIRKRGLTEFTFSRFLAPYLSGYEGWALFLDSDILVRGDVAELPESDAALSFVLDEQRKFEWSSVMWMNCAKLQMLTPEFVERENMYNRQWTEIGGVTLLPKDWNHLVGYDPPNPNAKIVHFTQGIPIWPETKHCEFSKEWWDCCNRANSSVSFQELMGRSVHVPYMKEKMVL